MVNTHLQKICSFVRVLELTILLLGMALLSGCASGGREIRWKSEPLLYEQVETGADVQVWLDYQLRT
jgi:hypothetical protein